MRPYRFYDGIHFGLNSNMSEEPRQNSCSDIEHLLNSYNVAHTKDIVGMEIEDGLCNPVVGRYTNCEENTFMVKWNKIPDHVFWVVRNGDDAGADVTLLRVCGWIL